MWLPLSEVFGSRYWLRGVNPGARSQPGRTTTYHNEIMMIALGGPSLNSVATPAFDSLTGINR